MEGSWDGANYGLMNPAPPDATMVNISATGALGNLAGSYSLNFGIIWRGTDAGFFSSYSVGAAGNGTNGSIGCDILFGYSLEQNGPTLNGLMGYGNSFQATDGLFNGGAWVSYDPRSPSISYLGGQFGVSLGAGYSNIMTYSTLLR